MKEIHSETDILTMQFCNKEKGRQRYQSLGSAFWLVRENRAHRIPLLSSTASLWTDYLMPSNPAHQWGVTETAVGSTEVVSILPGEKGE